MSRNDETWMDIADQLEAAGGDRLLDFLDATAVAAKRGPIDLNKFSDTMSERIIPLATALSVAVSQKRMADAMWALVTALRDGDIVLEQKDCPEED